MSSVFFYVSGHGYGHSIRQIEIINALIATAPPDLRIVVRTSAPPWLYAQTVRGPYTFLPGETDTGVVQIDSLRLDERATMLAAARFHEALAVRTERERVLLQRHDARLVVADVPPLACAAAQAAGIPSIVCGNFTWDWIYEDYAAGDGSGSHLTRTIREVYAHAAAGWRMPMHGGFESIGRLVDLPFVAREPAARPVGTIRRALGLPEHDRLALVSFGGYGVRGLPLDRLDCRGTWTSVLVAPAAQLPHDLPPGVAPVAEESMYACGLRYEDVVRAVDVVVTKPGYGIISDCIAGGTALLYTSRGVFAEYDVLVREMPRFLRCGFIPGDALFEGRWQDALDALHAAPEPPERARRDGAQLAAQMILERLGAPPRR